jgi:hypothetical protein
MSEKNEEKEATPAEVATDHVGLTTTVPAEDYDKDDRDGNDDEADAAGK